ncbi:MAG: FHA domain-containing protein [Alistipes sp.]|nr:FHA domain-containing protein [Alistipes sp.]
MRVYTIGRDRTCDYQIDDCIVGVFHLQIVVRDDRRISVVDFGSHIGTSLNGRRVVGEVMLRPRDELRIGDIVVPWQRIVGLSGGVADRYKPVAKPQNRTAPWVWGVIGCLAFLTLCFAAGMIWLYVVNSDKTAAIEMQQREITELKRGLEVNKNTVQELRQTVSVLHEERQSLDTLVDFYYAENNNLREKLKATQVELEAEQNRVHLDYDINYRY